MEKEHNQDHSCDHCKECLEILQLVADGEANEEQRAYFHNHILECEHCMECYDTEKYMKDCIKQKIAKMKVPLDVLPIIESIIQKSSNNIAH